MPHSGEPAVHVQTAMTTAAAIVPAACSAAPGTQSAGGARGERDRGQRAEHRPRRQRPLAIIASSQQEQMTDEPEVEPALEAAPGPASAAAWLAADRPAWPASVTSVSPTATASDGSTPTLPAARPPPGHQNRSTRARCRPARRAAAGRRRFRRTARRYDREQQRQRPERRRRDGPRRRGRTAARGSRAARPRCPTRAGAAATPRRATTGTPSDTTPKTRVDRPRPCPAARASGASPTRPPASRSRRTTRCSRATPLSRRHRPPRDQGDERRAAGRTAATGCTKPARCAASTGKRTAAAGAQRSARDRRPRETAAEAVGDDGATR